MLCKKMTSAMAMGLALLILLSSVAFAWERKLTEKELKLIDEMMAKYERADLFSGVILLAKKGDIVFQKAYGFADRDAHRRNSTDTAFSLASVTKLFTITAVLKLMDEGRLGLEDPLGKYLEGFAPDIARKVTLRHLITMKSGFRNYLNNEEFQKNPGAFRTTSDFVRIIKPETLAFEPGSREQYSNSGFVLLGAIVEKVTGKAFFDYVQEAICRPSGLTHTRFANSSGPEFALAYNRDINGDYHLRPMEEVPPCPAGQGYSTAEDLLHLARAFSETSDLLSEKARVVYFSDWDPKFNGDMKALAANPRVIFGWTGTLQGVSTMVRHYAGEDYTFVILSNHSNVALEIWDNIKSIIISGTYAQVQPPLSERIYKVYLGQGIAAVERQFPEWAKGLAQGSFTTPKTMLNELGGMLLDEKRYDHAVAILALNTKLFPQEANAWDSLGEAYMLAGDADRAIENYEKSLKLDPGNANAADKLKILKSGKRA